MSAKQASRLLRAAVSLFGVSALVGCSALFSDPEPIFRPEALTDDTTPCQAVLLALESSDDRTKDVAALFDRTNGWPEATRALDQLLTRDTERVRSDHLVRVARLADAAPTASAVAFFQSLLEVKRPLATDLAWQIAEQRPSPAMADAIAIELARHVGRRGELPVLGSGVAESIGANRVIDAYPLLRRSLLGTGQRVYARAMADVEPARAAEDLLAYLALADRGRLAKGELRGVNEGTASFVLAHLHRHPPSIHNPDFPTLFHYAAGGRDELAEGAVKVLERFLPQNAELMAFLLAQQPARVQLRIVGFAEEDSDERLRALLAELRTATLNEKVQSAVDAATH